MLFANCRHIPLDFRKNNILLAQTRVFTSKLMDEEDTIKRISIRELIAQNYNFTCSGNLNVVRKNNARVHPDEGKAVNDTTQRSQDGQYDLIIVNVDKDQVSSHKDR